MKCSGYVYNGNQRFSDFWSKLNYSFCGRESECCQSVVNLRRFNTQSVSDLRYTMYGEE